MKILHTCVTMFKRVFFGKTETIVFMSLLVYLVLHFIIRDIHRYDTTFIGGGTHFALILIGLIPLSVLIFALLSSYVSGEKWAAYFALFVVFAFTRTRFFIWLVANDFRVLQIVNVFLGLAAFIYLFLILIVTFKDSAWKLKTPEKPFHILILLASVVGIYVLQGVNLAIVLTLVAVFLFMRNARAASYVMIAFVGIWPLFTRLQEWTAFGTHNVQFYSVVRWLGLTLPLILFVLAVTAYFIEKHHKSFLTTLKTPFQEISGPKKASKKPAQKAVESAPEK